ncbi:MAG TPA: hypothetical protein VG028_14895 [Terriglobia bacterium]|nr:hypothetical protein [Terriglobia bacterium]
MKSKTTQIVLRSPRVLAMWLKPGPKGGQIDLTYEALAKGVVMLGWNEFKDQQTTDDDQFQHYLKKLYDSAYVANQITRFVREMRPSDPVLVPHMEHPSTRPNHLTCYAATVRGGIEVRRAHFGGSHGWEMPYREVEWHGLCPQSRRRFPKSLRKALNQQQTVWDITPLRPLVEEINHL